MPLSFKASSAFTLVELIIVISIMGIMAVMVLMNFSGARTQQQLSLLADKSVAILQNAQTEVRSGKYDFSADVFLCEGAHFVVGEEPLQFISAFDSATGSCDFGTTVQELEYGLPTAPAVVESITVTPMPGDGELYAVFTPPNAELLFFDGSGAALEGEADVTFFAEGADPFLFALHLSTLTDLVSLASYEE